MAVLLAASSKGGIANPGIEADLVLNAGARYPSDIEAWPPKRGLRRRPAHRHPDLPGMPAKLA